MAQTKRLYRHPHRSRLVRSKSSVANLRIPETELLHLMLLSLLVIMAKTRDLQVSWSSICQQRKAKAPWQTSNYQSRRTISSSSHPDHRLTVQLDSGKTQRLRMSGQEATLLEIRNTQSSPLLLQVCKKPMLLQFKSSHVSPRNTHDRATVI